MVSVSFRSGDLEVGGRGVLRWLLVEVSMYTGMHAGTGHQALKVPGLLGLSTAGPAGSQRACRRQQEPEKPIAADREPGERRQLAATSLGTPVQL